MTQPATVEIFPAERGICRHCGCTEANACMIVAPNLGVMGCSWFDRAQTICSNPRCLIKEQQRVIACLEKGDRSVLDQHAGQTLDFLTAMVRTAEEKAAREGGSKA